MTNPTVEPRKVVPLQDCTACHGSGMDLVDFQPFIDEPGYEVCNCVLDQLTNDNEPFAIDTTPNDLTKWVDVVEP